MQLKESKPLTSVLHHPVFLVLCFAFWISVIVLGFGRLLNYGSVPGPMTPAPEQWPVLSHIERTGELPIFLMLAHPKCPCSNASLRELEKMMLRLQGKMQAYVLFSRPTGFSDEQVKSSLWNTASKIPGVKVLMDEQGEANIFGAHTSGETFLYDKDGRLVFHGGITALRGHEGPNRGQQSIEDFILKGIKGDQKTLPFGCPLDDPEVRKDIFHES